MKLHMMKENGMVKCSVCNIWHAPWKEKSHRMSMFHLMKSGNKLKVRL